MQIHATAPQNARLHSDNRAQRDDRATLANAGKAVTDIDRETADPRVETLRQSIEDYKSAAQAMPTDGHDGKAQAKARLAEVKSRLEFLDRWGFPPELVARLAAELGRTVASAASHFSSGANGSASTPVTPEHSASAMATSSNVVDVATNPASIEAAGNEQADDEARSTMALPDAYRQMIDTAATETWSSDDAKTAAEFDAVAKRLKAMIEEALRQIEA